MCGCVDALLGKKLLSHWAIGLRLAAVRDLGWRRLRTYGGGLGLRFATASDLVGGGLILLVFPSASYLGWRAASDLGWRRLRTSVGNGPRAGRAQGPEGPMGRNGIWAVTPLIAAVLASGSLQQSMSPMW